MSSVLRWVAAVALVSSLVASLTPSSADARRKRLGRSLRVLTYNVHTGAGRDGQRDLARTAAAIRRARPHVVCLQELDRGAKRSGRVDQFRELRRLTRMPYGYFQKTVRIPGGEYGIAILSKLRIVSVRSYPLPGPGEPRQLLQVTVALSRHCRKGRPVHRTECATVLGSHFSAYSAEARKASVDVLVQEVLPAIRTDAVVFAADLNDEPDSEVLRGLERGLRNPFAERPPATWPAHRPRQQLDYVLYAPSPRWAVEWRMALDEPDASDHLPVLLVLREEPPRPRKAVKKKAKRPRGRRQHPIRPRATPVARRPAKRR